MPAPNRKNSRKRGLKKQGTRRKKGGGKQSSSRAGDSRGRGGKPGLDASLVLTALSDAERPLRHKALLRALGLRPGRAERELEQVLERLIRKGKVAMDRRGGYERTGDRAHAKAPRAAAGRAADAGAILATGTVSGNARGFGFAALDDGGDDVFLPPAQMRGIFHGDRVALRIGKRDTRGRRAAEVAKILERGSNELVGRLEQRGGVCFVVPSDPKHTTDLLIPSGSRAGARKGQIVVAQITGEPSKHTRPVGCITEILGHENDSEMEIEIAVRAFGIPNEFPDEVLAEAKALGERVRGADKQGREDLREIPLVTIDGADARDFDDAVHAERTRSGWRLRVAIADVSHYVRPGSALDREALLRGTSVYFPRRVVPMLPEELSNGLCSLKPKVDRLALVADLELDERGHVTRSRFVRAVIRSHARLTYTDVQEILDGDAQLRKKHEVLVPHLEELERLYQALATTRRRRGALELDQPEPSFRFDSEGKLVAIEPIRRVDTHRLIEECMIAANVEAARTIAKAKTPALYRGHEGPNPKKVEELRTTAELFGHTLAGGDEPRPRHFSKLLRSVMGRPEEPVLTVLTLRSLARATYRPECVGHFGLALDHYAHFTSPIRRYPDLLVHRAITHGIEGGKSGRSQKSPRGQKSAGKKGAYRYSNTQMKTLGETCSKSERRADEASWDVQAWLRCRFMEDKVGESFDGRITGVTEFGLFVRLDFALVEGLVHISQLETDHYSFEPKRHALVGRRSGTIFRLGDAVRVRCAAVRTDERKIELVLEAPEDERSKPRRKSQAKPQSKPQSKPRTRPHTKSKTSPRTEPGTKPRTKRKSARRRSSRSGRS